MAIKNYTTKVPAVQTVSEIVVAVGLRDDPDDHKRDGE